jgi:hypothetical protein
MEDKKISIDFMFLSSIFLSDCRELRFTDLILFVV